MKIFQKLPLLIFLACLAMTYSAHAQRYTTTGQIVQDFTMNFKDRDDDPDNDLTLDLHDLEGNIIVLDFFLVSGCPCDRSTSALEEDVHKYYAQRLGNPNGIPVQVLHVSNSNGDAVDDFVIANDLTEVVDDSTLAIARTFDYQDARDIFIDEWPRIVVINGLQDLQTTDPLTGEVTQFEQWEILHFDEYFNAFPTDYGEDLRDGTVLSFTPTVALDSLFSPSLDPFNPFVDLEDIGDGWRESFWFGSFNNNLPRPWIFHREHGFVALIGSSQSSVLVYDPTQGWLWTNVFTSPFYYRYDTQSWIFYDGITANRRWFYDLTTEKWELYSAGL